VKAQFEAVLEERNRISREIHDTLTQDFTAVILHLEAAETTLQDCSEETRNLLNYARDLARNGLVESRRFVRELRPAVLEKENLTDAILHVAQQAASGTALKIEMDVTGTPRTLSSEIEDNLVRIVREACTNAVRHSAAKNLRIELKYKMRKVDLEIIDDGCGFDLGNIPKKSESGFGLISMEERVRRIRGKFKINSNSQIGTHLHISVPSSLMPFAFLR
jgi:two-component system NarL family sensor kinase